MQCRPPPKGIMGPPRPPGALPDRAGPSGTREHLSIPKQETPPIPMILSFFSTGIRVTPASIMSISSVAISGRGAPNPASAGAAFCGIFMPLGRGADGPKEGGGQGCFTAQGTEPMMLVMPLSEEAFEAFFRLVARSFPHARTQASKQASQPSKQASKPASARPRFGSCHASACYSWGRCPPLGVAP